jgi:peptide-methionine (S)-S-oxide reductase
VGHRVGERARGALIAHAERGSSPAALLLSVLLLHGLCFAAAHATAGAATLPAASLDNPRTAGAQQTAVLAGGCFWGMQAVFEHVRGVRRVLAGYSGGSEATAHYALVGTDGTSHAESIQISFDPAQLSYGDILRVYFSVAHDPTELNRQGPDEGRRYRSDIFYRDTSQQRIAQAYIGQLQRSGIFSQPIVTRVDALTGFYAAEDYQQDFVVHNTDYDYVMQNDLPRIANLKRLLPQLYRDLPVLVSGG